MEDLIKRQDALEAVRWGESYLTARDKIAQLPAVRPERKKGKWIGIDDFPHDTWECDQCGGIVEDDDRIEDWKFCPNCGADMRGEQHETD